MRDRAEKEAPRLKGEGRGAGAITRVLRHEAGTDPITEEGWMKLALLHSHPRVVKFNPTLLRDFQEDRR